MRVLVQVRRGREHRSQAGGAKASVRPPRPLFLLALNTAQPDPNCWGWQVPHWLLVGVHEGSELSLGVVWASRWRQSGLAGKESGSDGHGRTQACPQSTPCAGRPPAAGLTGGQDGGNTVAVSMHDGSVKRA